MLFFFLILSIIIAVAVYSGIQDKKNTEAIKQLAESIGFTFNPNPQAGDYPVDTFKLFDIGHSKRFRNGMTQEKNGIKITQFEYSYTTGSGKNRSTYHLTVTLFQTPRLKLPQFMLKPEHIFHKIGEMFGAKDIDFEDSPQFSKKYLLKSGFEYETRELFSKELRDAFESKANYQIEGHTDTLMIHTGRKIQPKFLLEAFQERVGLFELFLKQSEQVIF